MLGSQNGGDLENETPTVIYVYAEPALLFQLRLSGLPHVAAASSLSFVESLGNSRVRTLLATGDHARKDPSFANQFEALRSHFRKIKSWSWNPSPVVSLDQPELDPSRLGNDPAEAAVIELFELSR